MVLCLLHMVNLYIYVTSGSTIKHSYTSPGNIISYFLSKSNSTSEDYEEKNTISNYHSLKNFYLDKGHIKNLSACG